MDIGIKDSPKHVQKIIKCCRNSVESSAHHTNYRSRKKLEVTLPMAAITNNSQITARIIKKVSETISGTDNRKDFRGHFPKIELSNGEKRKEKLNENTPKNEQSSEKELDENCKSAESNSLPEKNEASIHYNRNSQIRGNKDHLFLDVVVNDKLVRAYVDLGCEYVTLRQHEAMQLGLEFEPLQDDSTWRTCKIKLQVDLAEATLEALIVSSKAQEVPLIVGQSFTDLTHVTIVKRGGSLRIIDSTLMDFKELDKLPPRTANRVSRESKGASAGDNKSNKVLSLSSLLNQLQPNVRWSSSLKIRDKEVVQPERTFKYADLSIRLALPHQLQPKPNVTELVFGKYFTDHMLKVCYYEALGGWQMPEITPFENLVLHPAAKVLHYAVELFEGMKAYRGVDGKIRVFRPEMNMDRMNASAVRSGLPTFNGMELIKCINRLISIDQEWVPHSEASSLYIRPTLIGIDPCLGVAASESAMLYVILSPVGSYFKSRGNNRGVSLLADPRYTRAWPGGCGDRKMGSNYAPTIRVQKEATEKGLQQVLWLYGEDHQLTEAGTMNVFLYCINDDGEKELITPPLNGLILPGITRNSILSLAREWNQFQVSERKITMSEICQLLSENRLLELFGAGTACIVSPVSEIDYRGQKLYIPTLDHPEPIHKVFYNHLTQIHYGYIDHPWALPIE